MRYYKLFDDTNFIGVITEQQFRKYQEQNRILLVCDYKSAEYVRYNDELYRDNTWMQPLKTSKYEYKNINIHVISEEEYKTFYDAIHLHKAIEIITEEEIIEEDIIEEETTVEADVTVDFIKETKILDMSYQCNRTITNGFDIVLSDGNLYHFSMSIEDQINLLNISNMINTSDEKIIYHADGERCRYFSKDDMKMIIDKAMNFKTYHTTYFNGLKAYINSLNDIDTISNVKYGDKLPSKYTHTFLTQYEVSNK